LDFIQAFDTAAALFIQEHIRIAFLDKIMPTFTNLGEAGLIWIIISLILICTKKYRKTGFLVLLSMGICYLFNDILLKHIVMRPRPYETIQAVTTLIPPPDSFSFPSGHACSSFAAAFMLSKGLGKKGALFYILAAAMAISRPYVGVHYISDILVGSAVGTIGSALLYKPLSYLYVKLGKFKFFT